MRFNVKVLSLSVAMSAPLVLNPNQASAQTVNCHEAVVDQAIVACRRVCTASEFCDGQVPTACFGAHPVECAMFAGSGDRVLALQSCFYAVNTTALCAYTPRPTSVPCTPSPAITPVPAGALPPARIVHRNAGTPVPSAPSPVRHAAAPSTPHHASTTPHRSGGSVRVPRPTVVPLPRVSHGSTASGDDGVPPSDAGLCPEGRALVMGDAPTNTGTFHVSMCYPPNTASVIQALLNGVVVVHRRTSDLASALVDMHRNLTDAFALTMGLMRTRMIEESQIRLEMCAAAHHNHSDVPACAHQREALATANSYPVAQPMRELPASISALVQSTTHAYLQCVPHEDGSGCETQSAAVSSAVSQANAYGQRRPLNRTTSFTTAPPTY